MALELVQRVPAEHPQDSLEKPEPTHGLVPFFRVWVVQHDLYLAQHRARMGERVRQVHVWPHKQAMTVFAFDHLCAFKPRSIQLEKLTNLFSCHLTLLGLTDEGILAITVLTSRLGLPHRLPAFLLGALSSYLAYCV